MTADFNHDTPLSQRTDQMELDQMELDLYLCQHQGDLSDGTKNVYCLLRLKERQGVMHISYVGLAIE